MIYSIKSLSSIKRGDKTVLPRILKCSATTLNNVNGMSAANAFLETKLQVIAT